MIRDCRSEMRLSQEEDDLLTRVCRSTGLSRRQILVMAAKQIEADGMRIAVQDPANVRTMYGTSTEDVRSVQMPVAVRTNAVQDPANVRTNAVLVGEYRGLVGSLPSVVNQPEQENQLKPTVQSAPKRSKRESPLSAPALGRFEKLYLHKNPELEPYWPFERVGRAKCETAWARHAEPCTDEDVSAWLDNAEDQARSRKAKEGCGDFVPSPKNAATWYGNRLWRERGVYPNMMPAEAAVGTSRDDGWHNFPPELPEHVKARARQIGIRYNDAGTPYKAI